jgi:hypothetical protein
VEKEDNKKLYETWSITFKLINKDHITYIGVEPDEMVKVIRSIENKDSIISPPCVSETNKNFIWINLNNVTTIAFEERNYTEKPRCEVIQDGTKLEITGRIDTYEQN